MEPFFVETGWGCVLALPYAGSSAVKGFTFFFFNI